MASSVEHESSKKQAERLLWCLHHPENVSTGKFWKVFKAINTINNQEAFEQVRIQSDHFASIYPLCEGADQTQSWRLLIVLSVCASSSVSAHLLAKEKRIWGFVVALYEDHFINVIPKHDSKRRCNCCRLYLLIIKLIPYANTQTWEFAVQCGLLKHLLAEKQNEPRTCLSRQNLNVIYLVLSQPTTRGSIDTLVTGGLFTRLEQLKQKYMDGNLLKATPPCPDCNHALHEDLNGFVSIFLNVKKKKKTNRFFFFCSYKSVRIFLPAQTFFVSVFF